MNERIQQLAEQCYEHDQSWTGVGQRIFNKEKFAELIVAECLNQCYNRGMNDELYAGQLKAAEYIEQHFGVEE
jgi:hypothetical protein